MKHHEKVKRYLQRNGCNVLLEDERASGTVLRLDQSHGVIVSGLTAYAVRWHKPGSYDDDTMTIGPMKRKFSEVLESLEKLGYKRKLT